MALVQVFGCVRVVYNDALSACEEARARGRHLPSRADLSAALTEAKRTSEREWLTSVSSVPLQQALIDLERAYRNYFDSLTGRRKGGRIGAPRFRSRRGRRQSARFTANAKFHVFETGHGVGHLVLPKVGRVRFALSRPLPARPSSVSVIREADGRYYFSFVVDVPSTVTASSVRRAAGVDMGLTDVAAVVRSDGVREKIVNPKWHKCAGDALARAQRALSRKQKGSKNREKARHRVAVLHRRVREARRDHHHKLARRLIDENQVVAVEGLDVAALMRTRVAKSVQDAGWGILLRLLHEKAVEQHREVAVVDRWQPTSQVCAVCGTKDGRKPLHVRVWTCRSCSAVLDRDFNAAVNIMIAAGLAETLNACGGDVRRMLACADPDEAGTHRTDRLRATA